MLEGAKNHETVLKKSRIKKKKKKKKKKKVAVRTETLLVQLDS